MDWNEIDKDIDGIRQERKERRRNRVMTPYLRWLLRVAQPDYEMDAEIARMDRETAVASAIRDVLRLKNAPEVEDGIE